MLLKDKVIIISGIGPGMGIKLALRAAEYQAKAVVLAARTQSMLDDTEAAIRAARPNMVEVRPRSLPIDRKSVV